MLPNFPSPILSVAADVVRDLEGEDALCGLWTLFTKCKENLKDGRRLENLSWRLWYREMASTQSSPASSPGSLSPSLSDRRSPSPITPISEDGLLAQQAHHCQLPPTPSTDISQAHSWHGNHPPPSAMSGGRRLSTISTVSAPMERHRSQSSVGVGKLILDILPRKVDVDNEKKLARTSMRPTIVQPRPIVASVPKVQLPSTPRQPNGSSFPHVVVIVPTPHPTPPATPGVSHPPTLAAAAQPSSHLLPPQPARSLVSATIAPPPASTQSSVPPTAAPSPQPPVASSSASMRPASDAHSSGPTASKSNAFNEETLKASDRRFFLQDSGSPEVDSPERPPSNTSETKGQSPSSLTSSHMRSEVAGPTAATAAPAAAGKRPRVQVRKSKERHAPVRPALQRLHSHGLRQASQKKATAGAAEPKKAAFNIGSTSSNGSRAGPSTKGTSSQNGDVPAARPSGSTAAPAKQPLPAPQQQPKASTSRAGPSQQRRGIVISTSSEYDTTDTENDSEWASEADSGEERAKGKKPTTAKSKAQAAEEARLREAAEEAQRQRDMFAKVPKRSYSNLNRTRSGLLSQLFNPDPNVFPPNHPYRTTQSTQDMTQHARHSHTPMLQMSKSSAAVPLAAQVTAQAAENPRPGGGYRPKGRPQEEELDTESDDDNPDDTIQVSKSLAQQKLAALADPKRRKQPARGLLSEQHHQQQSQRPQPVQQTGFDSPSGRPGLTTVATAPIPLDHPYNLPPPLPPLSPRSTRIKMLKSELSESLRRNLLWERQLGLGPAGRRPGVLGGGLRPLTSVNGDVGEQQQFRGDSQQRPNGESQQDRMKQAIARNRSWADDYHGAGW